MERDVRSTIRNLIRNHLKKKIGKVFGQCLTAVGWVGGTLPELYEKDGMVEVHVMLRWRFCSWSRFNE